MNLIHHSVNDRYYMRITKAVVIAISCVIFANGSFVSSAIVAANTASSPETVRFTGTYSNLGFHPEGGDLLGLEIRIVKTSEDYQVAYQYAQGGRPAVMLAQPEVDKNSGVVVFPFVEFGEEAIFRGKIVPTGMQGQVLLKSSGPIGEVFELPRTQSYWTGDMTGTFSNLRNSDASGAGVVGLEIQVLYGRGGYQCLLQYAADKISSLFLLPSTIEKKTGALEFEFDGWGTELTFRGEIRKNKLIGKFYDANGEVNRSVDLARQPSYWERIK